MLTERFQSLRKQAEKIRESMVAEYGWQFEIADLGHYAREVSYRHLMLIELDGRDGRLACGHVAALLRDDGWEGVAVIPRIRHPRESKDKERGDESL